MGKPNKPPPCHLGCGTKEYDWVWYLVAGIAALGGGFGLWLFWWWPD